MKNVNYIVLLCITLLLGCNQEEKHLIRSAELVLPGEWHIETVELPKFAQGVTYQGNTIFSDTILHDLGEIYIPEIDAFSFSLSNTNPPPVPCVLTIEQEVFDYQITRVFIVGKMEIFSTFDPAPHGISIVDTPGEEFLFSSRIFKDNYFIVIVDKNHVRLERGNDREDQVIVLKRI